MLYHAGLFMPKRIRNLVPKMSVILNFSKHAERAALNRGIKLPLAVNLESCEVIEAEVYSGKLVKVIVRVPHDETNDVCLAISPGPKRVWNLRTAWLNNRADNHKTLNPTPYARKK